MKTLNMVLRDACDAELLAAVAMGELLKDMAPGKLREVVEGLRSIAERHALEWSGVLGAIKGARL